MNYYLVIVGPVALPVCGDHIHQALDGLNSHTRSRVELRHAPEPGCRLCAEAD